MCDPGTLGIIGSGIIGALGQTEAAKTQADTARDVASEQRRVQELNIEEQRKSREQALELSKPFRETGQRSLQELFNQATTPGLSDAGQLQLEDQQKNLRGILAPLGLLGSGRRIEEELQLGRRIGAQEQGSKINILRSLAGFGAQASGQAAGIAGQSILQQPITSGITGAGQAQVGQQVGLAGIGIGGLQSLQQQRLINDIFGNKSNPNTGISTSGRT